MRIACWRKLIYVDDASIIEKLRGRDFSPGKGYVNVDGELHEIDVVAPNVDESEFCKFNVCPEGTVGIEQACLEGATTINPIDKIKKITKVRRTKEKTLIKPLAEGLPPIPAYKYEEYTIKKKVKGCPDGYLLGDRTDKIEWLGKKKPMAHANIFAKENDLGVDVTEAKMAEGAKFNLKASLTCVKIEDMPLEKKWVEMVTDSIIGWGGFSEFPFWEIDWGLMNAIAEKRSHWTGSYMARHAELVEGIRVCWNEYNSYPCACFTKRPEALSFKESVKYYDYSNDFQEDTRKYLEEQFIDEKISEMYPKEQTTLYEGRDFDALYKKIRKQFKQEMEEEITEEKIQDRMNIDRESFYDDLPYQYESFVGLGEKSFRDAPVQFCSTREGGKEKNTIVLVQEDV